jgi:integrase/recombinase XerD
VANIFILDNRFYKDYYMPMNSAKTPIEVIVKTRLLTAAKFQRLADVPPEVEWFKNIRNLNTKRAYENAVKDFMLFTGIKRPEEFRLILKNSSLGPNI